MKLLAALATALLLTQTALCGLGGFGVRAAAPDAETAQAAPSCHGAPTPRSAPAAPDDSEPCRRHCERLRRGAVASAPSPGPAPVAWLAAPVHALLAVAPRPHAPLRRDERGPPARRGLALRATFLL